MHVQLLHCLCKTQYVHVSHRRVQVQWGALVCREQVSTIDYAEIVIDDLSHLCRGRGQYDRRSRHAKN